MVRIAICAPGKRLKRKRADAVRDHLADRSDVELHFHEQCFAEDGHFAGNDATRLSAFLDCANDEAFDAVWFAMGGYGSNRIAADAIANTNAAARRKRYLGYSDCGFLLGALYRHDIGIQAHGPLVGDIRREGGEVAIDRALEWLKGEAGGLEPSVGGEPTAAFNLTTLAMMVGTDLMPDLAGHIVMVEEVAEYHYSVDRLMFHAAQFLDGIAGLRLGRISHVPENDRPFGIEEEDIARHWCAVAGIPYLGRADIGHDADNKIVPFGRFR